jgi:trimeric autotransporter adhesin
MGEDAEREGCEMSVVSEMLVAIGVSTAPLTAGMATANAELRGFATEADATGKKASSSFNAVGMASLAVVGGVAAIGAESIKSATAFQSAMTLIQTQAGGSAQEVSSMSQAVLALAPTVGMGPDVLAAGLYHIESAGLRGADALNVLKVAAEGAKVGHADLETVTNALVAANQSGVKGVQSMTGAMGTLNAIVGAGNMRMQDLTDAMGTGVLSTAKFQSAADAVAG